MGAYSRHFRALQRRPKQLSGGQRQRVAMGRAIVRNPKVFLFDELPEQIDATLRVQMRTEIKRVHQQVKTTTADHVTHDQIEAMTLADYVVVMNRGRIEQVGTLREFHHAPKTRFVAVMGSPATGPCRVMLERNASALSVRLADGFLSRRRAIPNVTKRLSANH